MKGPRSIIFYAWAYAALQVLLFAGVVTFVLAGASYQRAATVDLHQTVQAMQLANLSARGDVLDAQRSVRGFEATGQGRFLTSYHAEQRRFWLSLRRLRHLAWPAVRGSVAVQGRTARAAFLAGDGAAAAGPGSGQAARLYARTSESTGRFIAENSALQRRLTRKGNALAAVSERTLGVGLPVAGAILAGLMLPAIGMAVGLRWASRPLHDITRAVRRRALGDLDVRAVPGGPADVRDLAASVNFLADESNRMRAVERERAWLQLEVRQASTRIREHLRAGDVIHEAVSAIKEHLWVDSVWVGLVSGGELTLADADQLTWNQVSGIDGRLPPGAVEWLEEIYRQRSSCCVQDLNSGDAEEIPAGIRKVLLGLGGASLLLTAFGDGARPLGNVTLLRNDLLRPWSQAEIEAVESLATDIGRGLEHARLYEGEERLVAELQSLDQAKTSFLASASHDLRTPLTSIIGYVEMLSDGEAGPVSPDQGRMLDAVERNARRLQALIEDMLTLSKIELGAFMSSLSPVELARLVRESADVIEPTAIEKGLTFEVSCPDQGLVVDGDANQLDRVILNLLSNAVKYTARGGVTVTAAREEGSAVVTVTDTGMGIPGPEQPSLFTRFFRASNAVERAVPGSGLGLSITRTIIEHHHGDISFESAEGAGTTFTVRIPLRANGHAPRQDGARRGGGFSG